MGGREREGCTCTERWKKMVDFFLRWVQLSSPVDGGMGIRVGNS